MRHTRLLDMSFLDADAGAVGVTTSTVSEAWNTIAAIRLMDAADSAVERFGVSGLDPIIQAAAAGCVDAHRCRSMAVVRSACLEIEQRAHALSATRHK